MLKEILKFVLKKNMRDRNKKMKSSLINFIRYNSDKMNGEERNAFEKELQKDQFAEEAAEGFSKISAEAAGDDMSELKRRMLKRTGRRSLRLFYRVAASLAIVVAISSIVILSRHEKRGLTVSQNLEKEAPAFVKEPDKKVVTPVKPSVKNQDVSTEVPEKTTPRQEFNELKKEKSEGVPETVKYDQDIVKPDLVSTSDKVAAESEQNHGEKSARAAMAGLKKYNKEERDYIPPQPVTGRDTFNHYLEKNMQHPEPGRSIQQVVNLSFLVYADSTISDIKIISSPGEDYSSEAIRLIKEGPSWKPAVSDNKIIEDSVRVSIVFK
jgi:hypothetical protein